MVEGFMSHIVFILHMPAEKILLPIWTGQVIDSGKILLSFFQKDFTFTLGTQMLGTNMSSTVDKNITRRGRL